jgi:phage-related minor tail protein
MFKTLIALTLAGVLTAGFATEATSITNAFDQVMGSKTISQSVTQCITETLQSTGQSISDVADSLAAGNPAVSPELQACVASLTGTLDDPAGVAGTGNAWLIQALKDNK